MAVHKIRLANGKIGYRADWRDKDGVRHRATYTERTDALLEEAKARKAARESKKYHVRSDTPRLKTIRELIEQRKDRHFPYLKRTSQRHYLQHWMKFLEFCDSQQIHYAQQVTPATILDYEVYLINKGISGRGIADRITNAGMLFREELRNGKGVSTIDADPTEHINKSKHVKDKPVRFLTTEELQALFSVMTPQQQAVFTLLFNTGMRTGELNNLMWKQIRKDVIILTDHPERWTPKTDSTPVIALNARAKEALQFFRSKHGGLPYVLRGSHPAGGHSIYDSLEKIISKASAKYPHLSFDRVTPHVFRKSYGSHMLQNKVPLSFVSKALRHKSQRTTERIYAELLTENVQEAVSVLEKVKLVG